jgi:hypothetical protein
MVEVNDMANWYCHGCGANLSGEEQTVPRPKVVVTKGWCPNCGEPAELKNVPMVSNIMKTKNGTVKNSISNTR